MCMKFSKKLSREKRIKRKVLEVKIWNLQGSNASDEVIRLRQELLSLDEVLICGAQIRSKDRFFSEYEKPNTYF